QVGGELAVIATNGESIPAATAPTPSAPSPTVAAPASQAVAAAAAAPARGTRAIASPRAKRIAAESGVDLARSSGSGPEGMITEDDVRRAAAAPAAGPQASAALTPARREKLTRIQAVGAKNLTQSWQQVPHFVQMVRVDMSRALEKRRAV